VIGDASRGYAHREDRIPSTPDNTVPRVLCCPPSLGGATQRLLNEALSKAGATVELRRAPTLRWAFAARRGRDILHLHWLEAMLRSPGRWGRWAPVQHVRAAHLVLVLAVARARGVRIVWTVHNIQPHEDRFPRLYRVLAGRVMTMADTVIAHSKHSASLASARFGRNDIQVVPHGSMAGFYPPARFTPAQVRAAFGFPDDAHVFLAFGMVRPYKRTLRLLEAFASVPHEQCRLVIAGMCTNRHLQARIQAAADADPRVVAILGWIPSPRVSGLHGAADVVVLPYDDIFSSGALILALSYGLPVIAPAGSTATEWAPPPIVLPFEPDRLDAALTESIGLHDGPTEAAREVARRHSWDAYAAVVLG
jgi:glycosyltransferase involved in cell wall biosynthesis